MVYTSGKGKVRSDREAETPSLVICSKPSSELNLLTDFLGLGRICLAVAPFFPHGCPHISWGDRVYADTVLRLIDGQGFGETKRSSLGSDISSCHPLTMRADPTGYVDDVASRLAQVREDVL